MKFSILRTTQFKRDVKRLVESGKDIEKLSRYIGINELAEGRKLAPHYRNHSLKGKLKGKHDCHIEPNWILLYAVEDDKLVLYRTGSHAHLFC